MRELELFSPLLTYDEIRKRIGLWYESNEVRKQLDKSIPNESYKNYKDT